jgi:hypothetical protein
MENWGEVEARKVNECSSHSTLMAKGKKNMHDSSEINLRKPLNFSLYSGTIPATGN